MTKILEYEQELEELMEELYEQGIGVFQELSEEEEEEMYQEYLKRKEE